MNSKSFAFISLVLVQVFYSVTFTFANDVIDGGFVQPFGFIFLRVIGATILFWIAGLFVKNQKIALRDYLIFFVAAFFGVGLNMLTFFKGLEFTTPIHASVIMTTVPIVVFVLSLLILKEKIIKKKVLGIVLGLAGAVILTVYGKAMHSGDNILLGNFLVFVNAASYGFYLILIKRLVAKYHPVNLLKWLFLFGLIIITPVSFKEFKAIEWVTFTPYISFSVIFTIVGATFITYLLNPLALRQLKASTVGAFLYLQPVLAGIFAILMGSDSINIVKIIATLLIFGGVYLVSEKTTTNKA